MSNSAEIIGYPYAKKEKEKKKLRILPHIIYKNQFKMAHKIKYKS